MKPHDSLRVTSVGLAPLVVTGIQALLPELNIPMQFGRINDLPREGRVVFMDVRCRSAGYEAGGAEVAAAVESGHRVVILTAERSDLVLLSHVSAGARVVLSHWDDAGTLRTALQVAAAGGQFVSETFPSVRATLAAGRRLSPRQRRVVLARADGATFREIALILNMSLHLAQDCYEAARSQLTQHVGASPASDASARL